MPCFKLLGDISCLKFSGTYARISVPKVEIDSTPKLLALLCLRSRTWPLLRFWVALSQNLKISLILTGDISILKLKISVAKDWRFQVWVLTDLFSSSNWEKVEHLSLYTMRRTLSCKLLSLLLIFLLWHIHTMFS